MWMDQVDTLHVDRYWSKNLCCSFMTNLDDLEVKVTDLEILCLQPRKYQLSNSQVSDNSKSVVKDKKLTVHNSYPGAI